MECIDSLGISYTRIKMEPSLKWGREKEDLKYSAW